MANVAATIAGSSRKDSRSIGKKPTKYEAAMLSAIDALRTTIDALGVSFTAGMKQVDTRFIDMGASVDAKHKQNRESTHAHAGEIDVVCNDVHMLKERMTVVEKGVFSIIGSGDGETGALNEVRRELQGQRSLLNTVQATVQRIDERSLHSTESSSKANDFMAGWSGVAKALAVGIPVLCFLVALGGFCITLMGVVVYVALHLHH